jgi:hypothetical protein
MSRIARAGARAVSAELDEVTGPYYPKVGRWTLYDTAQIALSFSGEEVGDRSSLLLCGARELWGQVVLSLCRNNQ